jgi:mono/diheme cytochrome c family protein
MRTLLKLVLALVLLAVLSAGGFVAYLFAAYPKVPPAETITVPKTAERLARGRYLAENVSGCVDCHSTKDWSRYSGPMVKGTEGKGGERFGGGTAPFVLYGKNITPAAIGEWTDGEVIRAITAGVSRDGTPLFPLMPYPRYAKMSREDIEAIVAYIRTLKPIANTPPPRELSFPMPFVVRTMPAPASHQPVPPKTDRVAYGGYLVNAAACTDCHTPIDGQGQPLPGMEFAGGMEFTPGGVGHVRSANITPDADTGIGAWSEEQFVEKFRLYRSLEPRVLEGEERAQNTEMPWTYYATIEDDDLRAMYAYLRSRKPVKHFVKKFE